MNVDHILKTLNAHEVAYLLIGGMNFLLRHAPVLPDWGRPMSEHILPKGCPVYFTASHKCCKHRGYINGSRIEPDGSLGYWVWDSTQGGETFKRRDELTVPRRRDRR